MKTNTLLLIAIVILASACGPSIKLSSNYEEKSPFERFHTFNFFPPGDPDENYPEIVNETNQKRLETAITNEMESKGYKLSDSPDLLISYYIKVSEKTKYSTTTTGTPYGTYYAGYYGGFYGYSSSMLTINSHNYNVGTLIIDMVNAKTNKLVWYGLGTKAIKKKVEKQEEGINNAVNLIFSQYPFLAGQKAKVETKTTKDRRDQ